MASREKAAGVPESALEALKQHEAAKMSRRAVLAKVGLRFGAAALAALSIDDIARKVSATLQERHFDNQIAQTVAQEFKNAGLANAAASPHPPGSPVPSNCSGDTVGAWCKADGPGCNQCCNGVYGSSGMCKDYASDPTGQLGISVCKTYC